MARREEQIELNLGGLLRQVYTTMFSSRAECMTHTLPRDRRFESLVIQRGVNNEPCSCRRLRLVAKQRRAFPNEKQGSGNRQYAELVGALTGRTVLSVFQFLVGVPHCPRKVGIGRSKMVGRYQQPARVDQISVRLLCRPLLRSLFHEAAGGAIKRARQVRIEL